MIGVFLRRKQSFLLLELLLLCVDGKNICFFFFLFSIVFFFSFFLLLFFSFLSSTDIFFSLKSGSAVSSRDSLSRHWTSINETFAEGQHQIIRHIMQKDVKRVLLPYSLVRSCLKLSHQMGFQFLFTSTAAHKKINPGKLFLNVGSYMANAVVL